MWGDRITERRVRRWHCDYQGGGNANQGRHHRSQRSAHQDHHHRVLFPGPASSGPEQAAAKHQQSPTSNRRDGATAAARWVRPMMTTIDHERPLCRMTTRLYCLVIDNGAYCATAEARRMADAVQMSEDGGCTCR